MSDPQDEAAKPETQADSAERHRLYNALTAADTYLDKGDAATIRGLADALAEKERIIARLVERGDIEPDGTSRNWQGAAIVNANTVGKISDDLVRLERENAALLKREKVLIRELEDARADDAHWIMRADADATEIAEERGKSAGCSSGPNSQRTSGGRWKPTGSTARGRRSIGSPGWRSGPRRRNGSATRQSACTMNTVSGSTAKPI